MSLLTQVKYDLGAICDSGDIGDAVTYYQKDGLSASTHVIFRTIQSATDDGMIGDSYLTAIIQKNDVADPVPGETFMVDSTYVTYKVLQIVEEEDLFSRAIVEAQS